MTAVSSETEMRSRPSRSKHLAVALAIAASLSLLTVTPAAAARHSTGTYSDPGGRPFLSIGLWGGFAYFGATWQVTMDRDAGQNWWIVDDLEVWGAAENGRDCEAADFCTGWLFTGRAAFRNAAGNTIYTIS